MMPLLRWSDLRVVVDALMETEVLPPLTIGTRCAPACDLIFSADSIPDAASHAVAAVPCSEFNVMRFAHADDSCCALI